MKKLFILLFALGFSAHVFAEITVVQVIGKWKYEVVTDQGSISGVFKFVETEGVLGGEVLTDEGYTVPISKIEMKEGDILYFEIKTDSDVIKVTMKIDGKTYKGTAASYMGEAPVTGKKME